MKRNKILYLVYFVIIGVTFTACKSKKALVQTDTIDRKLVEQVDRIRKAEPTFATANVSKMSVNVAFGGRQVSTAASCKIRTDSAIHISIQPLLGFELFKVEINKDSVLVFDKVNKKLYPILFSFFTAKFGLSVTFSDLQAMLANRFFTVGSAEADLRNCKKEESTNNQNIIAYKNAEMQQQTTINATDRIEKQELKALNSDYRMEVAYIQFAQLETILFPQLINLTATNGKRTAKFDFKISKAAFNNTLGFTKIDASKYTVGDINQLLKK